MFIWLLDSQESKPYDKLQMVNTKGWTNDYINKTVWIILVSKLQIMANLYK